VQTLLNAYTQANSSGTADSTSAASNSTGGTSSELFTTLLVAQIKNQDPLNPSDPSQFVNQLTQLSQMEALQNLVSQDQSNGSVMQSMQVMALGAQVGSQVTVASSSLTLGTDPVQGSFQLQSGANSVAVVLTDAAGNGHRIDLGTQAAGQVDFSIDPSSLGLPAGQYGLRVDTSTQEAPSVDVVGTLQSVKLGSSGNVVVHVAGIGDVSPTQIDGFYGRSTSQGG
jgi:flagellar basal-body rod modification protein FlgD